MFIYTTVNKLLWVTILLFGCTSVIHTYLRNCTIKQSVTSEPYFLCMASLPARLYRYTILLIIIYCCFILQSYWSVAMNKSQYSTLEHDFYKQYSTVEHDFYKLTTTFYNLTTTIKLLRSNHYLP